MHSKNWSFSIITHASDSLSFVHLCDVWSYTQEIWVQIHIFKSGYFEQKCGNAFPPHYIPPCVNVFIHTLDKSAENTNHTPALSNQSEKGGSRAINWSGMRKVGTWRKNRFPFEKHHLTWRWAAQPLFMFFVTKKSLKTSVLISYPEMRTWLKPLPSMCWRQKNCA